MVNRFSIGMRIYDFAFKLLFYFMQKFRKEENKELFEHSKWVFIRFYFVREQVFCGAIENLTTRISSSDYNEFSVKSTHKENHLKDAYFFVTISQEYTNSFYAFKIAHSIFFFFWEFNS